jgi:p-hydroxybenzoate 3-monooxygenase
LCARIGDANIVTTVRTQVGIVGGGPAGLLLGHLLGRLGVETAVIEARSRQYVIDRVRAGVLEQNTVDLLTELGLGGRLAREGMRHDGIYLGFGGGRRRIDMASLTGGRGITIYGQNEVIKDLIEARLASGMPLTFEVADVTLSDLETSQPRITYRDASGEHQLVCDFIAGCDGFHGVCRQAMPLDRLETYEYTYPFAWLGILVSAPPACDELLYSLHERGFALFSMRSPTVTRLYLQCAVDDTLDAWPDDRIWSELRTRLGTADGWVPNEGPIQQRSITGMRSFVVDPMRYGQLFLAGDAAHIVPPTGAKGLNLAVADVWRLAHAIDAFYRSGSVQLLDRYSAQALGRTWRAQRFSWWMTSMFHRRADQDPFEYRRQLAELEYVSSSKAAMTSLAENYVGFPLD